MAIKYLAGDRIIGTTAERPLGQFTFTQSNTNNQQEIYPPTGSSRTEVCQLYQTGQVLVGNAVTKASFFIRDAEVGGTATGNIKAYIRRIDGTEVEESTTDVVAANLTTSYEEKEFNFPATTIDANDMICINSDELTNGQVQIQIYNTNITNGLTYMRIGSTYSLDSNISIKMNVTYGAELNLTNGTIFEESDTGNHYMWNGSTTWNEVT